MLGARKRGLEHEQERQEANRCEELEHGEQGKQCEGRLFFCAELDAAVIRVFCEGWFEMWLFCQTVCTILRMCRSVGFAVNLAMVA